MSVGHMVFVCLYCFFTSEHKDRKFAEVQWSEGEDSRKFSEVKTDNIRFQNGPAWESHFHLLSRHPMAQWEETAWRVAPLPGHCYF